MQVAFVLKETNISSDSLPEEVDKLMYILVKRNYFLISVN